MTQPDPTAEKVSEWEVGTCALCGQELVRTPDDCWHPYTVKFACPPEPRGSGHPDGYDDEGWAGFFAAGKRSNRPGREHFRA